MWSRGVASSFWWIGIPAYALVLFGVRANDADTSAEEAEVTIPVVGVAGTKILLPCNITPPTPDDSVSLILWYKDESTTPLYSLDARRGSLDQARHAASDILASRAYLTTVLRPASLQLDPAIEEDQGEYRCRVDFRKARTRNALVLLTVIVPPEKPIIMDQNGEVLQSLIGPYNEGDRLQLICETEKGKPTPSLTWWRENVLLDDAYEVTSQGVVRNHLDVPTLQRHDLMALLTCQAINNNLSLPASSSVTVDMNFRPLVVQIDGDRKPLSAEKPVEVVCKAAGSRPPATITWWKGSTKMKRTREKVSVDGNVTVSVLTFTPSSDDSGKYLSCRAENPLISGSALEDGWKLEIHYVPQLSLRLGSKLRHSHIQEGNDVYFECNIRASPWVTDIRWWFEGREIHTNTSAGVIVSNQSLVLQRVQRTNRGRYTCSATNTEGEGESNPVHLRVQYSPICKPGQKTLYGAARHEAVKVTCEVEGDPSETTFRWAFNNSADNLDLVNFISEGSVSVSTYIPRTEFDYGTLFCWGRNSVGEQQEPCMFTVIPAGPPDPVKNCTLVNQTEDAMTIECTEGYDGGLTQHFIMEVHDPVFQKVRVNLTSPIPVFVVQALPAGTSFLLIVFAANVKGRSKAVALSGSTLAAPESLTRRGNVWQLSFNPILVVLIVVVVGLVLVALVIVFVMKFRMHKERKRTDSDRDKLDKLQIPLHKDGDVCTYNPGDPVDDKCPDVIPVPLSDMTGLCNDGNKGLSRNPDGQWKSPLEATRNNITCNKMKMHNSAADVTHFAGGPPRYSQLHGRCSPTPAHMAPMRDFSTAATHSASKRMTKSHDGSTRQSPDDSTSVDLPLMANRQTDV